MLEEHFLHRFFNPRSVAVVGASTNRFTPNYQLVNNLVNLGYEGKVYPVNPKTEEMFDLKVYKTVSEIDNYIDLVVISIPAHSVLQAVRELPDGRIGGVVLITGGFSEIGEEGRRVQQEIATLLKGKGIRTMGPNVLSPVNSYQNFAISFFPLKGLPRSGISFIFQSGMYEPRFNWILSDFHLGISKLIDLGNKMDVNEVDALEYLAEDPETKAIFIHLESIKGDPRRFFNILRTAVRTKPVVVLKGGRTGEGARAVATHTGSIVSGNDAVFDSAMRQVGAIRVDTLDDFLYCAKAFSCLPPLKGNRIAIATFPGGEAVLAIDYCMQNGLVIARPGQSSYDRLKAAFPAWEIPLNPFDFGICYTFHTMQNNHGIFVEAMLQDENVDCMCMQLPPDMYPINPETFCAPFLKAKEQGKPLVVWPPYMLRLDGDLITYLEKNAVPVYPSGAIAIRTLAALNQYRLYSKAF